MKFHWGWGIALFYSLFVVTFLIILFFSFGQDNSLVVEDYYQQDITYQEHLNKKVNYQNETGKVQHSYDAQAATITLLFPDEMHQLSGSCLFYRPSSARQDYVVALQPDAQNRQIIPVNRLIPGQWYMKLEWEANGKSFFTEEQLHISVQ